MAGEVCFRGLNLLSMSSGATLQMVTRYQYDQVVKVYAAQVVKLYADNVTKFSVYPAVLSPL